ncbi:mechanosensitive ion channel domain-containing protein [Hyphobacterium sp. HN65]|uniref:Mechanosensitive ion channel domain-containing protein n=1 Tax=Hyphobacterium lacteum TaxID=3116575 RepID=A0ABU7LLR5_9PROT|nr:mechanosensitive ion channel domain-containing protein [Hyphobacterium sp. HN65]MEE2524861.1 mechanosensitive ion channel domain-containing protein [Hyphobacterium sp. HN65]
MSVIKNFLKWLAGHWKWGLFLILAGVLAAIMTGRMTMVQSVLDQESFAFTFGETRISAWGLLTAMIALATVFWIVGILVHFIDQRIRALPNLRSSTRTLITNIIRIILYVLAFIVGLDIAGVDLTALTVFGGALGIGLGFGLQKIASNFVSGIILLAENAIEEGDLIELSDGTMGFVRKSSARYILLETFDGREILVPNEDMITGRVINWTLNNTRGRIQIDVGVAYGSDLHKAQEVMLEAARSHPMTIEDPAPVCVMTRFGDSSIDFMLLFWVGDVAAGRIVPQSEVMFAINDGLKAAGITIPFPQRDVHMIPPEKAAE